MEVGDFQGVLFSARNPGSLTSLGIEYLGILSPFDLKSPTSDFLSVLWDSVFLFTPGYFFLSQIWSKF